jgi:hypothetical protein
LTNIPDPGMDGRIRISRLGGHGGQVIPQRAGVVAAEEVRHVDGGAAALAELGTLEVEVFSDTGCKTLPV